MYSYQADKYEAALCGMRARIRFNCVRARRAGMWITAMPTNPKLTMSDMQYKLATLYRIGGKIYTDDYRTACNKCTKKLDLYGEHAMLCGNYENLTKRRHDAIRNLLYRWAKKANYEVIKEKYGLFGNTDPRKPADILIYVYLNGETWCFDVVVKAPFAKDARVEAMIMELGAAAKASLLKQVPCRRHSSSNQRPSRCWAESATRWNFSSRQSRRGRARKSGAPRRGLSTPSFARCQ